MRTNLSTSVETGVCSVRGTTHPLGDLFTTHDGSLICEAEFDANWGVCVHSGEIYSTNYMHSAGPDGGEWVHASVVNANQYRLCAYTNTYMPRTGGTNVRGTGWISEYAIENGPYFTCADCGNVFRTDDLDEDYDCTCVHCASDRRDAEEEDDRGCLIHDYSCRDYPSRLGKGPLFVGVELEVEVVDGYSVRTAAELTMKRLTDRFVILKDDGSIDRGFEIVTAPATFEKQREHWAPFFDSRPPGLRSWDTETCGMHVHVSKNALSSLQLGKLLVFVNRPEHEKFMIAMAGRNPKQWAAFREKKITDATKCDGERYRAINTCGDRTIEFRIFKGTLNRHRFFGNLEFVEALVQYTAPSARSITDATGMTPFCEWVGKERKRFPNLFSRLVDKGFHAPIPKKEKTPVIQSELLADSNT